MNTPAMIIGGHQVATDRERRVYRSPATGEPVTEILLGTAEDVDSAVAAARQARAAMTALSPDERVHRCLQTAEAIERSSEELAPVLSAEHGKPAHSEALGELLGAADAFRQAAGQARWSPTVHFELSAPEKRLLARRRPRGTYAVITPWNFPVGLACMYYLAPGLAAANTLVWLGAPSTNAIQAAIARIVADHWPAGALNFLTGDGPQVGEALVAHPGVDAVGFTGSTATGRLVAQGAAGRPTMLELGGNGPTVVLADADVALAAARIARGSFTNAGQICTATGRVLVDERVADSLAEALVSQAEQVVLGDPADPATTMGPVHLTQLAQRIVHQISDAATRGARILTGGATVGDAPTGNYVRPTIVDRVDGSSALHRDETFGPAVPIVPFRDHEEMHKLIDSSPYGLHAAVFSRDLERAIGLAEQLRFGHINLNDTSAYWEPSIPAGGAAGTPSGIGRSGGPWSVLEMTELFTMTIEARTEVTD